MHTNKPSVRHHSPEPSIAGVRRSSSRGRSVADPLAAGGHATPRGVGFPFSPVKASSKADSLNTPRISALGSRVGVVSKLATSRARLTYNRRSWIHTLRMLDIFAKRRDLSFASVGIHDGEQPASRFPLTPDQSPSQPAGCGSRATTVESRVPVPPGNRRHTDTPRGGMHRISLDTSDTRVSFDT